VVPRIADKGASTDTVAPFGSCGSTLALAAITDFVAVTVKR